MECIILSVKEAYMDAQEVMHMTDYSKITALYSRLSVGDEDRDGGESNSIQNQKIFLENYARGQHLTNIRHYIDDDESGRFFDRSAYSRMIEDVESGKIGVCIMKDLTRWGRDYLQVGNAMEIFRRNNVRFIAVNNGIDSENPDTLEFAPFINIMSEWYAKDISKKVKTGIKTKGMSGKPVATEAPYGYIKDPDNRDFWIIDEEAAEVVRLIFRLFLDGKNRNQITVYLTQEQIPTPTFYMKDRGRGTCKNKTLNEDNRYKWNKATLTHILTRQEYCGDVVNFKTTKHFRDKRNHYVDRSQWHITENVHEPIIDRTDFENVQRILENAPVKRPNGDGEIHPLSGLLFCKDCGAKMHIRIDYRNGGKRHVAFCSEYHKGKAKNPKCHSPHIMDADLLMQTIAEVLKKIEDYSISNRAEFEALVKKNLAMQQTDGGVMCGFDSFLGFRHGPKAVVKEDSLLVYLVSRDPAVRRYEEDLIRQIDANNRTAAVVAVSAEPYAVGGVSFDLNVVLGGGDTGVYGCIPYVFTAQLLGYYKSLDRGLNPDSPSVSGNIHRVVEGVTIYPYER